MDYINYIKAKAHIGVASKSDKPVLSDEDEKFLDRMVKQENPLPLVTIDHGGDPQVALMDGAQNVALPPETPDELGNEPKTEPRFPPEPAPKRKTWNWLRRDSRDSKRQDTAAGLHDIAEGLKSSEPEGEAIEDAEAKKEEEDMTVVLERLNLAAVDNRVFSISEETQQLLQRFNQVLQDLMNGVPTAYHDLESLLTNGDQQIQKTYNSLPSFLQKLVEKLPETMTKGMAPEMMAAAAERASKHGINLEKSGKAAGSAAKFLKTPSLKDLVGKPSAITAMLKSIMQFLRARFPAFAGVNVLWSLALSLLLIVFWYCHKRGRETRLDKEREMTEQEVQQLEKEWQATGGDGGNTQPAAHQTNATASSGTTMDENRASTIEGDAQNIAAAQAREPVPTAAVP